MPGSDGAGIVQAVGSSVQDFRPGDRVVTHLAPKLAEESGDDAPSMIADISAGLGQTFHGTLQSEGVFPETGLVRAPNGLGWVETATLTCSGLTAWNCLFGIKGLAPGPGSWVLTQGTGGVCVAALQFAVAAGATVVATTSTDEKANRLKELGATHVVNYRTHPDTWGEEARKLTPDGKGFDMVIDIAGDSTLGQSLSAVRADGIVLAAGFSGGQAPPVPLLSVLMPHGCMVRGLFLGTRNQFKDMVRFVEEKGVVPAVDDVVFELADAKSAYQRLQDKKHFSKVVIRIDH